MKLSINFRNMQGTGDIVNYIDHRLSFAFARTRHNIEQLTITVADINGPKGGTDKQCQVVVKPTGLRKMVISGTSGDVKQAIDRCLARASQSLNRKLKKRQVILRKKNVGEVMGEILPDKLSPV